MEKTHEIEILIYLELNLHFQLVNQRFVNFHILLRKKLLINPYYHINLFPSWSKFCMTRIVRIEQRTSVLFYLNYLIFQQVLEQFNWNNSLLIYLFTQKYCSVAEISQWCPIHTKDEVISFENSSAIHWPWDYT